MPGVVPDVIPARRIIQGSHLVDPTRFEHEPAVVEVVLLRRVEGDLGAGLLAGGRLLAVRDTSQEQPSDDKDQNDP